MSEIQYYSTNLKAGKVSFSQALLKGLAPDGGLFMPESLPSITLEELKRFKEESYDGIAFEILRKFVGDEVDAETLRKLTHDAYNFDVPLELVYGKKYIMRLDRGPTASFKDFAARMMGRLMNYFLEREKRKLLILTATSGDTGSAIANAFYGLDNIKVIVLYPEKEVTDRQRRQMTTLQKNVQIIALNGKFDDCQAMVKKAFSDPELDVFNLSSANSINIGRLIPQSVYYVYACSKLCDISRGEEIVFSVPSGNFGNLMGGLLAKHMGLPVRKFIVATNENDEVPQYFLTGDYHTIDPSVNCISSAMNVGHPSNMARIVALYKGVMNEKGEVIKQPDMEKIRNDMYAVSITDIHTKELIRMLYDRHKVLLEPHGAVGWGGLRDYFHNINMDENQVCVSLETAHPAKFPDEIREVLGIDPELPLSMKGLEDMEESFVTMENNYQDFKHYLKNNY
jgi:threonine synthase